MNTNKTAYEKPSGYEKRINTEQSLHIIEIAKRIQDKILLLEKNRLQIDMAAQEKAVTAANYDKELAVTLIKLKNGIAMGVDGNTIQDPPASTAEKIARGICFQQKMEMEMAENKYKSIIIKLDTIQAEMNGLQSLNRHLEHEV